MSQGMVCVSCAMFMRRKKNGVVVEEGRPLSNVPNNQWGPYKLWMADLFECPSCGYQIISGFAQANFAEHYQSNYAEQRTKHPPLVTVNDCGGARP